MNERIKALREHTRSSPFSAMFKRISPAQIDSWATGTTVPTVAQLVRYARSCTALHPDPVGALLGVDPRGIRIDPQTHSLDCIGPRLRETREEQNCALEWAAQRIGVTPAELSDWESGAVIPSIAALGALSDIHGATITYLMGFST